MTTAQPHNRELELLNRLLRSHPKYGQKPLSINDCLRNRKVPYLFKAEYVECYNAAYPTSVPMVIPG